MTLFPYQVEGANWLAQTKHALLADSPGLGKTAQVIDAIKLIQKREGEPQRVLVLGPSVSRPTWNREFKKWGYDYPTNIIYKKKDRFDHTKLINICSYDLVNSALGESGNHSAGKIFWDVIVLDESHLLKSIAAQRTVTILGRFGLVHKTKRVWALSGTPAPNHAGELWPLLFTFGATKLPYDHFIESYCNGYWCPISRKQRVIGTRKDRIPELREVLKTIMKRRRTEDVLTDLPPIHYMDLSVEASPVDMTDHAIFAKWLYPTNRVADLEERLEKDRQLLNGVEQGPGISTPNGVLALEALAKSVSSIRVYTGLQKLRSIVELVSQELDAGYYKKIVIFAIHRDVIEGLRRALYRFCPVTLYGNTPPDQRERNIEKFQQIPKFQVFIANIHAAGTNITLTAANQVLFAETDWVPANNAQAAMRCHRIGQTLPVFVRFAGLAGSIDEKIASVLRRKTRELTELFGDRNSLQAQNEGATAGVPWRD